MCSPATPDLAFRLIRVMEAVAIRASHRAVFVFAVRKRNLFRPAPTPGREMVPT
jgi:hypothetical protein